MLTFRKFCEFLLLLNLSLSVSYCADIDSKINKSNLGIFAVGGIGIHSTNSTALLGNPTCCVDNIGGVGDHYGLGVSYIFSYTSNWSLTFDLRIDRHSANFVSSEKILLNIEGEPIDGLVDHISESEVFFLPLQVGMMYKLYYDLFASFQLGSSFHISNSISQYEELREPQDSGVFPDTGTRVRNRQDGEIAGFSGFIPTFEMSLSKRLPLSMKSTSFLQLSGTVSYTIVNANNISQWSILTFKLLASFHFPV